MSLDQNALRTHQAALITVLAGAFIVNSPVVVAAAALLMLAGTLMRRPAFLPAYRLIMGLGWIEPDLQPDRPEPHRFAHQIGTVVLLASTAAFLLGSALFGWSLALLVAILAGVNLFFGFCVGCALYYWFARLGIPMFSLNEEQNGSTNPTTQDGR